MDQSMDFFKVTTLIYLFLQKDNSQITYSTDLCVHLCLFLPYLVVTAILILRAFVDKWPSFACLSRTCWMLFFAAAAITKTTCFFMNPSLWMTTSQWVLVILPLKSTAEISNRVAFIYWPLSINYDYEKIWLILSPLSTKWINITKEFPRNKRLRMSPDLNYVEVDFYIISI